MTWLRRYQLKRTLRRALWLWPALAILAALAAAPLIRWLDHLAGWTLFNFTPDGARTILGAFTSSMLTFVVFVMSSLLIVVQLASAQLTPRMIAGVFADGRLKGVLSVFTFSALVPRSDFPKTFEKVVTAGRVDRTRSTGLRAAASLISFKKAVQRAGTELRFPGWAAGRARSAGGAAAPLRVRQPPPH